ncbi:hypothetical protein KUV28_21755 [Ferrimonas balearica]|nr:hypothetical protein [Ferrimonas balearica]
MTSYIYRIAMIVPDAQVEAARRIAAVMGWGAGTYSVPLSASGKEPATHWGLSTSATQIFVDQVTAAGEGVVPEGVEPADLAAVLPVLGLSIGPASTNAIEQFDELCSGLGVSRVTAATDP